MNGALDTGENRLLFLLELILVNENGHGEITYDSLTIDDVKEILSKQNIGWNEINKNRIVGRDYDTNIYLELFKERGSDKVTLILQKRN